MPDCLVSLGSNLGDSADLLHRAVQRLRDHSDLCVIAVSSQVATPPIGGPPGQAAFLNAVVRLETSLSPFALLAALQRIEQELGRQRQSRWDARTIDLDLLLYGDSVLDSPELAIPHPRMAWRRFVLEPAADVAGDMRHPVLGWTVQRMLEHLNAAPKYLAITGAQPSNNRRLAVEVSSAMPGRLIADAGECSMQVSIPSSGDEAYAREFQAFERRQQLLARQSWIEDGRWAISDFWLGESLAVAKAIFNAEQLGRFERAWRCVQGNVVEPKLIVLLDDTSTTSFSSATSEDAQDVGSTHRMQIAERIRELLLDQLSLPGQGPLLRVSNDDWAWVHEEVLAALRGME